MNLRNLFCIFALILVAQSFTIVSSQSRIDTQASQKIPEYVGLGYNVLTGNPFTDQIDPGFKSSIFQMTYDKAQTTGDNKYLIPDFTHATSSIACSLQSRVSQYTGTQNYQKQLQRNTKIDTRLSLDFLKAAFSFSRAFQQFTNSTQTYKQTSCQSNAECTIYTVDMPIYSNDIPLSRDFIGGVRESIVENDWSQFIDHFGTHFASSVTFGGRYLMEHTYTEQSMSLFKSMNLDIKFAAEIQYYQKIGLNLSDQQKKYQNQTNVINNNVDVIKTSTIGGLPPRSDNWIDWANTVKDNLAPVSYQLTTISVLFNFIPSINVTEAVKSFTTYVNTYCQRNRCPPLTPERPDPKPLAISFTKTAQISGPSKSPKAYDMNDGNIKVAMRVSKILLGVEGSIDSFQFFLSDGIVEHDLPIVGYRQPNREYVVPAGDEIRCIRFGITYNLPYWKYTTIQVTTKKGVESAIIGGSYKINQYRSLCVENADEHLVGFYGCYGRTFDSIGFNLIKETLQ